MNTTCLCPYCDGEIRQGTETCPYCDTNLKTGRQSGIGIGEIILYCFGFLLVILAIILYMVCVSSPLASVQEDRFKGGFGAILGIVFILSAYSSSGKRIAANRALKKGPDEYHKLMVERRLEYQKKIETKMNETSTRLAHTPICPICGSKEHVNRISTLDRSVSTAVVGIASSSIGKQWECTACRHKFNVDASGPTAQPVKIEKPISLDPTEELRKYKKLLDDGVITQEDFDQKKRQLLEL